MKKPVFNRESIACLVEKARSVKVGGRQKEADNNRIIPEDLRNLDKFIASHREEKERSGLVATITFEKFPSDFDERSRIANRIADCLVQWSRGKCVLSYASTDLMAVRGSIITLGIGLSYIQIGVGGNFAFKKVEEALSERGIRDYLETLARKIPGTTTTPFNRGEIKKYIEPIKQGRIESSFELKSSRKGKVLYTAEKVYITDEKPDSRAGKKTRETDEQRRARMLYGVLEKRARKGSLTRKEIGERARRDGKYQGKISQKQVEQLYAIIGKL